MGTMNNWFGDSLGVICNGIDKHHIGLGIGFGTAGFCLACVETAKATVKAVRKIDEYKESTGKDSVTVGEAFGLVWKDYIKAGTIAAVSAVGLIVTGKRASTEIAGLSAATMMYKSKLEEYVDATKEVVNKKQQEEIEQKVAQKEIDKSVTEPVCEEARLGKIDLFVDSITNQEFYSTENLIDKAINIFNARMTSYMYGSVDELMSDYADVAFEANGHIKPHDTTMGSMLGWSSNMRNGILEASYTYGRAQDGTPARVIEYNINPSTDYRDIYRGI